MSGEPAPTRAQVEEQFTALLAGSRTRDEVDRWAAPWVTGEAGNVDDQHVWWALKLLCGIDLRPGPGEPYLHDDEQVAGWLDEFRRRYGKGLYEPAPPLRCPFCSTTLDGWRGPERLGVVRQGATGQERTPEEFVIETNCPNDGQPLTARCRTRSGVWMETQGDW